jgi:hypothetical protein
MDAGSEARQSLTKTTSELGIRLCPSVPITSLLLNVQIGEGLQSILS